MVHNNNVYTNISPNILFYLLIVVVNSKERVWLLNTCFFKLKLYLQLLQPIFKTHLKNKSSWP